MNDKPHTTQNVKNNPLPNDLDEMARQAGSVVKNTYASPTTEEKKIPDIKIARILESDSINTQTRRILKTFRFDRLGAIQIGEYIDGVSGDLRITGAGLIARNQDGEETVRIDGETGDATFLGIITAGGIITESIITESIMVDGSININDVFIVDEDGNIIANSIALTSPIVKNSGVGLDQIFTSESEVDVTGSEFEFTLDRETIVMFLVNANGWVFQGDGSGAWDGDGILRLIIDDGENTTELDQDIINGGDTGSDVFGATAHSSLGIHYIATLAAGTYTIKLTGATNQGAGTTHFNLYKYRFSMITLGSEL